MQKDPCSWAMAWFKGINIHSGPCKRGSVVAAFGSVPGAFRECGWFEGGLVLIPLNPPQGGSSSATWDPQTQDGMCLLSSKCIHLTAKGVREVSSPPSWGLSKNAEWGPRGPQDWLNLYGPVRPIVNNTAQQRSFKRLLFILKAIFLTQAYEKKTCHGKFFRN